MFHVERTLAMPAIKGKIALIAMLFLFVACGGMQQAAQISDYILVPNGKEVIGNQNLTAFVFENNRRNLPIEQFLSEKFETPNYSANEFWVTIDNEKYKLLVYDYSEFEKYFNSSNYAPINIEPENARTEDKRAFIAISMINSYNEDCLASNSLYQNLAVKYLKNLKDEYYNQ